MRRPDRHVDEHPGARRQALVTHRERDLAGQDVESFLLPAVDVRGWTAARRHESFPQRVFAVRVVAGGEESVHITDDGHGAAFAGLSDDGLCHGRLLHLIPEHSTSWLASPTNSTYYLNGTHTDEAS